MNLNSLTAISPLDGRYREQTFPLSTYFSEAGLIHYRVRIEVEWFIFLCEQARLKNTRRLNKKEITKLRKLYLFLSLEDCAQVKEIEKTTRHDVKAVEYFIKEKFKKSSLKDLFEFMHFGCTSEDINNLSYSLMLKEGISEIVLPSLFKIIEKLKKMSKQYKDESMLARTHGQPASPTTMGKEMLNFLARMERQINNHSGFDFLGKFNGAVGNYNAHTIAYPEVDWLKLSSQFVESFGLTPILTTAQTEPHDFLSELFQTFQRINTILIDYCRDMWTYISYGYFVQETASNQVGSSTMPHKVNPIDFENAEGNLGMANAILCHFAEKLPISRLQRDLSDSTVLRNIGVALGHSLLAYESLKSGLSKLTLNHKSLETNLANHPEILTEAIQTILRKHKQEGAYEKLKSLSRGKKISLDALHQFIDNVNIPQGDKKRLKKLTPKTYTGLASKIVDLYFK